MEENKNLNNQPQEEEEEKKKKKGIIAWWFGLRRIAQIGICIGAAAVIATAITLPIVLTRNNGGTTGHDISVTVEQDGGGSTQYLNPSDYPTSIKSSDTTFKLTIKKEPPEETQVVVQILDQNKHSIPVEGGGLSEHTFLTGQGKEYTVTKLNFSEVTSVTISVILGQ